ncbi:MAG: hypothetical protein WCK94_06520 [Comamonadaceae bacterium]|jgi:hypothetical protein
MTLFFGITLPLLALYLLFLAWYGGKGKPLRPDEIEAFFNTLGKMDLSEGEKEIIPEIRSLLANDDGQEFVMQNLVRHRPRALYPAGYHYSDDARAADQRYGKAIILPLLRQGSLPIFIARRSGSFIEPEGADLWHYVAMVRYRSRRDFLRFALAIQTQDIAVHKWAALEKTHVFPVKPLVSLLLVRSSVAGLLVIFAAGLLLLMR